MGILTGFVATGVVFLLTLAAGLWLSRAGKPYNSLIFNVHKLIALAAAVLAVIQTRNALRGVESQVALIALLGLIGLAIVALFVTGALMSANKPAYNTLLTIHRIAPPLAVSAAILALFLLGGRT